QKPSEKHDRLAGHDQPREGGRFGGRRREDEDVTPGIELPAEGVDEAVGPGLGAQHSADDTREVVAVGRGRPYPWWERKESSADCFRSRGGRPCPPHRRT